MLTIQGEKVQTCAGTRREFLQIGGLAMGGLTLPQILAAEAMAGVRSGHRAVICSSSREARRTWTWWT